MYDAVEIDNKIWQRLSHYNNKRLANAETVRLQREVPTCEKFTVQVSALYFRHHVIRQRWQRAPR